MVAGIFLTMKTDRWLKKKVGACHARLCVSCPRARPCSSPPLLVLQWQATTGWILCLTLLATVSILPYVLEETPVHPSAPHALYSGTHRSLWALALTWIIVACEEGYGGKRQHCHINSSRPIFASSFSQLLSLFAKFHLAAKSICCNHLQRLVSRLITFHYCRFCQPVLVLGFLDPSVQHQFCQLLGSSSRHHSPPVPARQFNELLGHQLCEYFQPWHTRSPKN